MKPLSNRPTRSTGVLFQLSPVAAGAALLLAHMGPAHAQPTPAGAATQVVTVTGIRRGIESAINAKKGNEGVAEAISAEDIGKLPDTTIAESLARLPGVTTQRTQSGKASTISIRGLGPDFNGYLLNGREQTSVGDSRAVDLSVYPAELIGGATVYKTSDAGLMTAGLAGTIDNKLINPLDFGSRVFAASVQKTTNNKGLPVEGDGKSFSLSYIDQFADRKVGVALGFVRADGTTNELGAGGWGDATVQATLANGTVVKGVKVPTFGNGLDQYKNRRVTDERTGAAAILAFKPNKDLSSQLDLYYGKIDAVAKEARLQGGLGGNITNATVVDGVATKGTFNVGASPGGLINRTESIFTDDTIQSLGWRTNWNFAPGWRATVDLSQNSAKRIERDIEAYAGVNTGADTFSFDTSAGGIPQFSVGRPLDYTNPATMKIRDQSGWSGIDGVPQAGYTKGPTVEDKVKAIRLDLRKDLPQGGLFADLQFGVNRTNRSKDRVNDEGLIVSEAGDGGAAINFPAGAYVENNIGGTGLNLLTFDPQAGLWPGATIKRKFNDDILSKTWRVQENVTTAYLKAGVDTKLAGIPVRGNVGVQMVNTDQSSGGYRADVGPGVVLVNPAKGFTTDGTKYTDVLPSLNLTGELADDLLVRVSMSQQIARADMTDLRNSFAASTNKNTSEGTFNKLTGSAGNPHLKPFKAKAFDLSFEKYFGGNKGVVSVAGFYKQLDSYITNVTTVNYDFANYLNQLQIPIPTPQPNSKGVLTGGGSKGTLTQPTNGKGGNIHGIEVGLSMPFGMFVPAMNGFGVTGSYSVTASSVSLPLLIGLNPNQTVPAEGRMQLPGLSKENRKLEVYYEAHGFSARVSNNARSTYVGSVANDSTGGYPTLKYIQGSNWVSAQIGYELQSGPAKGLGIRLEGNNLNKPVYRQLNLDGSIEKENSTGATVSLKLHYKFQ